jgi:hypothetical protein
LEDKKDGIYLTQDGGNMENILYPVII